MKCLLPIILFISIGCANVPLKEIPQKVQIKEKTLLTRKLEANRVISMLPCESIHVFIDTDNDEIADKVIIQFERNCMKKLGEYVEELLEDQMKKDKPAQSRFKTF